MQNTIRQLAEEIAGAAENYGNWQSVRGGNLTKQLVQAILATPSKGVEEAWLIFFEDAQRKPEVFFGCGAEEGAKNRFKAISSSWNATLFKQVQANFQEAEKPQPTPTPCQAEGGLLEWEKELISEKEVVLASVALENPNGTLAIPFQKRLLEEVKRLRFLQLYQQTRATPQPALASVPEFITDLLDNANVTIGRAIESVFDQTNSLEILQQQIQEALVALSATPRQPPSVSECGDAAIDAMRTLNRELDAFWNGNRGEDQIKRICNAQAACKPFCEANHRLAETPEKEDECLCFNGKPHHYDEDRCVFCNAERLSKPKESHEEGNV